MTATPRLRVLRIFGRYQEYGGEEAAARRIHETLKPYLDAEWLKSSTDALLSTANLLKKRHNGANLSLDILTHNWSHYGAYLKRSLLDSHRNRLIINALRV
jgi:hypothetical protein